jgi:uncharacterized protein YkuJ
MATDSVVREISVVILPVSEGTSINRLQFTQEKTSKLDNCTAQYKQNVKQLEVDYNDDNENGIGFHLASSSSSESYHGDGFAQLGVLNHAIGFIKDNKLFLLPIHQTYDMKRKMVNKAKEAERSKQMIDEEKMDTGIQAPAPVRVKFARHETEWQKKRREQSSLHKQRMAEQDPWIPLEVEKKDPREVYKQVILDANNKPTPNVDCSSITVERLL